MRVRSSSLSAETGLKAIAGKKTNNPVAVMSVNKKKIKKKEINNFCSFKDSPIFNLEFIV